MNFRLVRSLVFSFIAVFMIGQTVQADVVDDIKNRGKLIVGVKADYKPYGFRNTSGAIVGIEPELAQDVADMLGVKLELLVSVGIVVGIVTVHYDKAGFLIVRANEYISYGFCNPVEF